MSAPPPPSDPATLPCPLCGGREATAFHQDRHRPYLRCGDCALVWVPPAHHLSPAQERAEYDRHCNDPDDSGYRRFLGRLHGPLQARLAPASQGLDFGSGPGPTLSRMFEEGGHHMALYDPCYAPDATVLERHYDFITASEVVEHLARPGTELDRLWGRLRPGGWLGLMTKLVRDAQAFAHWHYKADPTHIVFWSRETFTWLAGHWGTRAEILGADVILLRKPDPDHRPTSAWR